jgi:adenine-specific DNA-methyltransferase
MCDYIGSKRKLTPWIFSEILEFTKSQDLQGFQFIDACSGSGWVSRKAAELGSSVVACDLMLSSKYQVVGSIGISRKTLKQADEYIRFLNSLTPVKGYFYENYSPAAGRPYMTEENACILDAIRDEIDKVQDEQVKSYLIYCTIEAFSRIMNTSGHTVSFLKQFKSRAKNELKLRREQVFPGKTGFVLGNVSEVVKDIPCKARNGRIFYMDPPYNERQYGNNYHLYETIVRNDKPNIPKVDSSICGYRDWQPESKSKFCSKKDAALLIASTVEAANPRIAFISYSSDSLAHPDEIISELTKIGFSTKLHKMNQTRYNADNKRVRNTSILQEYLFEIVPS